MRLAPIYKNTLTFSDTTRRRRSPAARSASRVTSTHSARRRASSQFLMMTSRVESGTSKTISARFSLTKQWASDNDSDTTYPSSRSGFSLNDTSQIPAPLDVDSLVASPFAFVKYDFRRRTPPPSSGSRKSAAQLLQLGGTSPPLTIRRNPKTGPKKLKKKEKPNGAHSLIQTTP